MWYLGGTLKTIILLQYCKEEKNLNSLYSKDYNFTINEKIYKDQSVCMFSKKTYNLVFSGGLIYRINTNEQDIVYINFLHKDLLNLNGKLIVFNYNKNYELLDYLKDKSIAIVKNKTTHCYNFMSLTTGNLFFSEEFVNFYGFNMNKKPLTHLVLLFLDNNREIYGVKENGKTVKLKLI